MRRIGCWIVWLMTPSVVQLPYVGTTGVWGSVSCSQSKAGAIDNVQLHAV